MQTQTARYQAWFEKRRGPRQPDDEAALLLAAKAFDRTMKRGTLSNADLHLIAETASHSRTLRWANSADLLGKLSGHHPKAADAILFMSKSRNRADEDRVWLPPK